MCVMCVKLMYFKKIKLNIFKKLNQNGLYFDFFLKWPMNLNVLDYRFKNLIFVLT